MTTPLVRVGDLAEQVRGVTYVKEDVSATQRPGFLPILRAGNITNGGLVYDDLVFVPASRVSDKQKVCRHDVVVAASSGSLEVVGKAAPVLSDFPGSFGAFCKVLRPNAKVAPGYFAQFFKTSDYRRRVSALAAGANINNLRNEHLDEMQMPLPPLPEQRRIAEILDKADALRAKRRAALAQLDTLTQSTFLDAYREAAKSSRLVSLAQIAETSRGSFVNGPFGSDLLTRELQNDGVPVVYIRDIRDGEYRRVRKSCISEQKAGELAVCRVTVGDVLVAKVGDPPGVAAVYPIGEPPAVVTQDVVRIRVQREVASPEFIVGYLNSPVGKWKVAAITVQATRARFSLGEFKTMEIRLPSIELQRNYAQAVTAVNEIRAVHRASLAELDALFASLQHRAFRGEL